MDLAYPIILYPMERGTGFTVEAPDMPGLVTEGDSLAEAILMAQDAAGGWILDELEDGKRPPHPTPLSQINLDEGGIATMVAFNMDTYAEKYGNKAIRKNLTIPAWLATFAEENDVNYSQVLRDALEKIYAEQLQDV
jgi:predicted RNase H-like HicB family nuclease